MPGNDGYRRYIEAAAVLGQVTRARAEELAKELMAGGDVQRAQAQQWVDDLIERSRRATEEVIELVRGEVANQLNNLGLDPDELAHQAADILRRSAEVGRRATRAAATGRPRTRAAKSAIAAAGSTSGRVRPAAPAKRSATKASAKTSAAKKTAVAKRPTAKKGTAGTKAPTTATSTRTSTKKATKKASTKRAGSPAKKSTAAKSTSSRTTSVPKKAQGARSATKRPSGSR